MEQLDIQSVSGTASKATILRLKGPLTLSTLFEFQSKVREPGLKDTIIDLTEVPYIDSAGLGSILSHWAHTQRTGDKFAVAGACDRVKVLFQLTKVDSLIPAFGTCAEAEQSF
jgi:anti-anti-sigma factor